MQLIATIESRQFYVMPVTEADAEERAQQHRAAFPRATFEITDSDEGLGEYRDFVGAYLRIGG